MSARCSVLKKNLTPPTLLERRYYAGWTGEGDYTRKLDAQRHYDDLSRLIEKS